MWDLIVSVPDHCLSFYFICFKCICLYCMRNVVYFNLPFGDMDSQGLVIVSPWTFHLAFSIEDH